MSFSLHMRLPSARSVTLMRARSPGAMTSALGVTLNAPMLIDGSGGDCGGCALAPRNRGSCACAGAGCCSGRVLCAPPCTEELSAICTCSAEGVQTYT